MKQLPENSDTLRVSLEEAKGIVSEVFDLSPPSVSKDLLFQAAMYSLRSGKAVYKGRRVVVKEYRLEDITARAVNILRSNEPLKGYYLAFSGGKDSCVIKHLAHLAGINYEPRYNNTTIDPPELVRFIKEYHKDVLWNNPLTGNMFHRIATTLKTPPTRKGRWCCEEYKEQGGGRESIKIIGVRAAESPRRAKLWKEITEDIRGGTVICPIVSWSDGDVWDFIRFHKLPYCSLYDEGWERLGCVGCPLVSKKKQDREFARWPRYEELWRKSIIANWETNKDLLNTRTGEPRYQAKFATGEDFWTWWRTEKRPDVMRECQSGRLFTNVDEEENDLKEETEIAA
jgi:phosphoadenosine phosphosulfate reductase